MWYVKEDEIYLWVTNDSQSIKIGKKGKSHNIRVARHEVERRNKNNNVVGIDYSNKDIKKMISYVVRKAKWFYLKKKNLKIYEQDLENCAYITMWKCMKKFKPEKNYVFITYFVKSFFKNCVKEFMPKKTELVGNERKLHYLNVRITQKLIQKSGFSTLSGDDSYKSKIEVSFDMLNEKQKKVIKGVFYENKSMAEIGREMGLTRARIQQICSESLKILRDAFDE